MIEFSDRLKELMANPQTTTFYLVRMNDMYFTDFPTEIRDSQGQVYTPTDLLKGITQPELSGSVGRDLYKFTLVDAEGVLLGAIESNLVGSPVHIKIGFVDPNTGQPELNDMFVIYDGFFESGAYSYDTSETGEVLLEISCSNPMGDLDSADPIYCSDEAMRKLDVNDNSYEFLFVGSGSVILRWGKT